MIRHSIKRSFLLPVNPALIVISVCLVLIIAGCRQEGGAEAAFIEIVGPSLTIGMTLRIDRPTYTYERGDDIIFRIENRTDHELWFADDNFGVRGFSYDPAIGRWKEVNLNNQIISPRPYKVPAHYLLYGLGNLDTGSFREIGRIRLVVRGCLSLERIHENCADYITYQDITVTPRR